MTDNDDWNEYKKQSRNATAREIGGVIGGVIAIAIFGLTLALELTFVGAFIGIVCALIGATSIHVATFVVVMLLSAGVIIAIRLITSALR